MSYTITTTEKVMKNGEILNVVRSTPMWTGNIIEVVEEQPAQDPTKVRPTKVVFYARAEDQDNLRVEATGEAMRNQLENFFVAGAELMPEGEKLDAHGHVISRKYRSPRVLQIVLRSAKIQPYYAHGADRVVAQVYDMTKNPNAPGRMLVLGQKEVANAEAEIESALSDLPNTDSAPNTGSAPF